MKTFAAIATPVIFIALLLAIWEAACRISGIAPYLLPPPSAIGASLVAGWPLLLSSAWNTLVTALTALAISSIAACSLALLTALSPMVERAVRPLAVTLQVTPVIAIAPLLIIWAGLDHPERAVLIAAAIVAFFPIYSGAVTGLKAADPDLERLFDLYGAGRWQKLVKLRLPSSVPFLLEGHKVAAGLAVIGAVMGEFVAGTGGSQGLAWRILEASNRLQTARVFAALLVLAVMAALLYAALQLAERKALIWWRGR
ncbi:MAG: ABC transporter permease [Pseudomonadota bacterium]